MEVMGHSSTFLLPSLESVNGPSPTYALVILNQRLPRFTPLLWKHARLHVCADGGANRIFDEMPLLSSHEQEDALSIRSRYKPDVIKGDMDSIRPEVRDFYSNLGTKIIDEAHDQDTTDLHKCISYIRDFALIVDKSNLCVLVAGALGGRFDHEIGNINVLYKFSGMRIILISDDCLIHLLPSTHTHEIHIHSSVEGPHCGLIPIGMSSGKTTTTGLQWDLNNSMLQQWCLHPQKKMKERKSPQKNVERSCLYCIWWCPSLPYVMWCFLIIGACTIMKDLYPAYDNCLC